jgi:hydroxyethylthiazole kinase-like uncharacterized protein yjeF
MQIVDSSEMKEIDRVAIEEFGIPDELLMENAGVEFTHRFLREFPIENRDRVGILCGGGNNGGDGFVIARHMRRRGVEPVVFLFVDRGKLKGIALSNYERLSYFGVEVCDCSTEENLQRNRERLGGCRYLVDALLGIGFRGKPRGMIEKAIAEVNGSGVPVISVDMPSGVDADGTATEGPWIEAETTYTIGLLKYGLVDYPGKAAAGRIEVLDIGFPAEAVERSAEPAGFIDKGLVEGLIPPRMNSSHKGSYGHLAVFGGRVGYEGASLLCSRAALRSGCGLVTLFAREGAAVQKPDEVIVVYLPQDVASGGGDLGELIEKQNAVVIGPGLGVSDESRTLLQKLLPLDKRLLIDADGLNTLSQYPELLEGFKAGMKTVITPHVGEMMRLTGLSKEEVKADKRGVALAFAKRHELVVVLKDAVTVIATAEDEVFINDGGVAALSKGGSGDVLSGIIGSLMARGLSPTAAAVSGVYLHTECGRNASPPGGADSVQAGDLIDSLPGVFSSLHGTDVARPRGGTAHGRQP